MTLLGIWKEDYCFPQSYAYDDADAETKFNRNSHKN